MTDLDRSFKELADAFLADHGVPFEWRTVRSRLWGDRIDLICAPGAPNEVYASSYGYQIAVGETDGDHEDFEDFGRGLSHSKVARDAFEHLVHLLRERGHVRS